MGRVVLAMTFDDWKCTPPESEEDYMEDKEETPTRLRSVAILLQRTSATRIHP